MPIQLVGGFRITSKEPIDDRLVVTGSNGRFVFDAVRVHDGLTVFTTSSKQYHILVDSSSYTTEAGWRQVFINQSSGSFNLTGSLTIVSGNLAVDLNEGNYSNVVVYDTVTDKFYYTSSTSVGQSGFPFSGSAVITGSLTVSGSGIIVDGGAITLVTSSITSVSSSINFTTGSITIDNGSITAPSFIGTASWATNALTASKVTVIDDESTNNPYAIVFADPATGDAVQLKSDASTFLYNPSTGLVSIGSDNSYTLIASGALYTFGPATSPYTLLNQANQTVDFGQSNPAPGSNRLNINHSIVNITGNITASVISASSGITGSLFGTASWANNVITASHALTASSVNTLNQNVTINGTLTAYTGSFNVLQVNYISSSIIYSSGSNTFGDELSDTQILSGSVYVVGPNFTWNGSKVITSADTGSMTVLSASYASSSTSASYASSSTSASYALNATSASYASNATSASYATDATSASYASNATSASYAVNATSASYASDATSASYAADATSASYAADATSASYAADATSASYASNATSASYASNATSASYASNATSASYASNATSASYASNATSASYAVNATSASYASNATSASYAVNATSASYASTASYVNTLNQDVTINGTTSTTNLTVTSNATITGNLTVNGTTTYVNVNDLLVKDKFILLNSGSLTDTPNEGGIIVQTTSSEGVAYGAALYYDQEANRWVVNRSGSVAWNATSSVLSAQSDFIVTVTGSTGAPTGTPVNFGTGNSSYSIGQMYINTSNSDIYIYA
jgi:hypothetical protein